MRTFRYLLLLFSLVMLFGIVSAQIPIAGFSGMPTIGQGPLTVTFTDQSTGNPTGWAWYFGDETYTAPWTQVNASAGWSARGLLSSVTMPNGSIVLMGGVTGTTSNDVWCSTDNGATWTQLPNAGWSPRWGQSAVAMPDGSIVLMGGWPSGYTNDVWRSMNNGTSWILMNASAGWTARGFHSSVAMPDGSIVLMGGNIDQELLMTLGGRRITGQRGP